MKDELITYPTAILAKDKGFDIPTLYGYDNKYQCPTQSLLQRWLREKHNIEVYVIPIFREKCGYDSFKRDGFGFEVIQTTPCQYLSFEMFQSCGEERDEILNDDYNDNIKLKYSTFKTYEQALEIGLQEALKLIQTT